MNNYYKSFIFKIIDNDIKNNSILGKIVTRFAPDPNGFLHIGHAKSLFLNYNISKKYNGLFNLRFDDTNPLKTNKYYVKNIIKDIRWLGINWNGNIKYTSDYFNNIFCFAIKLIKNKLAYVDELSYKKYKIYKGNYKIFGINSPYRNRSIEENLKCFINMKKGFYKENEACLRAKINMKSSNIIIRDPVLYRIKFIKHFKTKNKWCIYPTYDFSHCICDYLENITYSLCTLEFQNNKILYNWILDSLNIKNKPKQIEFSKLNIENLILSKRKLNILIKKKIIKKWNDLRILTISGLKNKGYTSCSIRNFCNNLNITKKDSIIKIKFLENFVKKEINKKYIKIMSVLNPIKLYIYNLKNYEIFKIPIIYNNILIKYKYIKLDNELYVEKFDFLDKNKKFYNIIGKFIKLKYSYIIKIKNIKIYNNNLINVYCKYYSNTINTIYINNEKVYKIIHWVSCKHNYKTYFKFYNFISNNLFFNKSGYFLKNNKDNNSIINMSGFTEKSFIYFNESLIYNCERIGFFNIKNVNYKKNIIVLQQILKITNKTFF